MLDFGIAYRSEGLPEGGPVVGGGLPALAGHAGAEAFLLNGVNGDP